MLVCWSGGDVVYEAERTPLAHRGRQLLPVRQRGLPETQPKGRRYKG